MKKLTLRRQTLRTLRAAEVGRVRGGYYKSAQCQDECTQFYSGCTTKSEIQTFDSCDYNC